MQKDMLKAQEEVGKMEFTSKKELVEVTVNGNKVDMSNYEKITEFLKKDKENKIVVKRDKKEYTFTMVLGKVNVPSTSENVIESKGKRIGYISLTTFSANSAEDFQNSLLALKPTA